MEQEERQLLFTTAWLFAEHGQRSRARVLCEALVEDAPQDGVAAAMLANLLLWDQEPEIALRILRGAQYPRELHRAAALLETRALWMLGRGEEGERRWKRYLATSQGARRNWVEGVDATEGTDEK